MDASNRAEISLDLNVASRLLRFDSSLTSTDLSPHLTHPVTLTKIAEGNFEAILALCAQVWLNCGLPEAGIESAIAVAEDFFSTLEDRCVANINEATAVDVDAFIHNVPADGAVGGPESLPPVPHLRRNVIKAISLTIETYDARPLEVPDLKAAKSARPATHDEVLLLRLAVQLMNSQRAKGLAAATVAAFTSGAATSEAAKIQRSHVQGTQLELLGHNSPTEEKAINARTVTLDPWAANIFNIYLVHGVGGRGDLLLYGGVQEPTSNSAQVSVSNQVKKTLERAGLAGVGLTPESLRMWASLRDVVDHETFIAGAARYGTNWDTLYRRFHRLGDRRLSALRGA